MIKTIFCRAALMMQSAIHVVDSCFTFGILDRIVVHSKFLIQIPGGKMLKNVHSWLLAIRPKTLTAAVIPVLAATCLAVSMGNNVSWWISLSALLSSFCIQIGTNLINDALDFKKGADTSDRVGPVRVTQSGLLSMQQVYVAGLAFFFMALLVGIPLIFVGGLPIAILMAISVVCGYVYTGGPRPLAYCGLGDIFVFVFFGLVSTMAVFYLQTKLIDWKSFLAGLQIGLFATVLIAINNLRDHKEDAVANKRTLAVRFGVGFSRMEIACLALLPFALNSFWLNFGYVMAAVLPLITLPLAILLIKQITMTEPGKAYNGFLAESALLHLSFGVLLSLGFLLK